MTAINALATKATALLLTDTAMYKRSGLVVGFSTKVTTLPHLNLAFATCGPEGIHEEIKLAFSRMGSLHEVIDLGANMLRELWDAGDFEIPGADAELDNFRLFVAGWSDRSNSAEIYTLSSLNEALTGSPFTFFKSDSFINPSIAPEELARLGINGNTILSLTPEAFCRIIDVQRRTPSADPYGNNIGHFVGGCAVLTSVNAVGIAQVVVRRWPDGVGYIDPSGDPPAPDASGPTSQPAMNRQQRRALERDQRRAAGSRSYEEIM